MTTKRALIVDDSKTAQHRLKKLLSHYDLSTVAVDSGEAALSYLSRNVPDVVFMDHLMPGLDGFRALQIIKSHPSTATIPVIMYTSKSGDVYTSEARALGALDVVGKDTVNAADLRKVLQGIHIYERETTSKRLPLPSATSRDDSPMPTPTEADETLSLELRLRELEHTIDDNRRIMTSRLVREMQSVRYGMRKVLADVSHLRSQTEAQADALQQPGTRQYRPVAGGPAWTLVASMTLATAIGVMFYWIPEVNNKLNTMASEQSALSNQVSQIEANEQPHVENLLHTAAPEPDAQPALSLLPDLSWAINQHSVQDFHAELVSPELTRRITELISRLASHDYQGEVQLSVSGGNFCVVTSLSGEPRLPASTARMRDCMLMSELYGADATTLVAERLESDVTESALLDDHAITITVQPLGSRFESYPEFSEQIPAANWNRAARSNNRVLINLEPAHQARTAQR